MLIEGAKEVKLFGETIMVSAQIHNLEGFSGHADRDGLLDWLSGFQRSLNRSFWFTAKQIQSWILPSSYTINWVMSL